MVLSIKIIGAVLGVGITQVLQAGRLKIVCAFPVSLITGSKACVVVLSDNIVALADKINICTKQAKMGSLDVRWSIRIEQEMVFLNSNIGMAKVHA